MNAFELFKRMLVLAPIIISPDWPLPFKLICDASDFTYGVVLGQRNNMKLHVIYYASGTLIETAIAQK